MKSKKSLYHRHRFPQKIIRQAVWLYYRFRLSYRDFEELLAQRGVNVSYETVWNSDSLRFADRSREALPKEGTGHAVGDRLIHGTREGWILWRRNDTAPHPVGCAQRSYARTRAVLDGAGRHGTWHFRGTCGRYAGCCGNRSSRVSAFQIRPRRSNPPCGFSSSAGELQEETGGELTFQADRRSP